MADVAAFFSIKAVYEGPGPVATGLFNGPSHIKFGVWENQMFTASPLVVMFNTEQPIQNIDTSQFLRVVVDDKANLTLQDGNGTVVSNV